MYKQTKILALVFLPLAAFAQKMDVKSVINKLGQNPIYIVDSVKVAKSELGKYSADSIATVIVLYDTSISQLKYGSIAKDGAVIIETRFFARQKFVYFFQSISSSYDSLYRINNSDTSFVYILNNKVLRNNFEGKLSGINKTTFIDLSIISKNELAATYKISEGEYGIFINTKIDKNNIELLDTEKARNDKSKIKTKN